MITYTVTGYDCEYNAHLVREDKGTLAPGRERYVDLMNSIREQGADTIQPQDLIGKTIKARREFPWIAIAVDIEIPTI